MTTRNQNAGIAAALLGLAGGLFAWWRYNNATPEEKERLKNIKQQSKMFLLVDMIFALRTNEGSPTNVPNMGAEITKSKERYLFEDVPDGTVICLELFVALMNLVLDDCGLQKIVFFADIRR